jgi:hypothetical protein
MLRILFVERGVVYFGRRMQSTRRPMREERHCNAVLVGMIHM